MREIVYIFGHKNPDTDSTCSAIAYANLKNQIDSSHEYVPVLLGEPNKETQYVLKQVDHETPKVVHHLKPHVTDLEIKEVGFVKEATSIKSTLETIVTQVGRSIPVVGVHDHLIGVVSISDILPLYMSMEGQNFLKDTSTPYSNLMSELTLTTIHGKKPIGNITGRIILFDDIQEVEDFDKKDILFCDIKTYNKGKTKGMGVGVLVLANVQDIEGILIDAEETRTILMTDKSLCALLKVINQTAPIKSVVKKDNLEYFSTYETIDDVKRNMLTSKFRRFPVVDENGFIKGMISKGDLFETRQKKAILVDHNEKGQSIDGIEDIHLMEVIDHHRVADIQTMGPLYFRVEPVGCTSTIVAKIYDEQQVKIDKKMAKIMLSAILSDTLLFKSPTSTEVDEAMANKLAKIAGVDIQMYGMQLIHAGADLEGLTAMEILTTDLKRFTFGDNRVIIAQTNTSDFDGFFKVYDEVLQAMRNMSDDQEVDLVVLLVTDVVMGGTELIAVGPAKWIVEQAFKVQSTENSIFLPNVFSRKKQVVPNLMKAAKL